MNKRVLLVDDEAFVLKALRRQLEEHYDLSAALGPGAGLELLQAGPPFGAIVADMRMPGMDGVQFLAHARRLAPTSVRMMLTGNADQATAIQAVNEGSVFRFLNKPAETDALICAIDACLEQHRLLESEKELLEKTLSGSVRVLVEILSTANPESFGRAQVLKDRASRTAQALGAMDVWQVELAAMLCQIGLVALPPGLANMGRTSARLPEFEAGLMSRVPVIGASLLKRIPRLEEISEVVLYQDQRFDGTGTPGDGRAGAELPLGSRILKVLKDFAALVEGGATTDAAFGRMRLRSGWYDPDVMRVAADVLESAGARPVGEKCEVRQLVAGDELGCDVVTSEGILLASAGQVLTEIGIARICAHIECGLLKRTDPVYVVRPDAAAA